MQLAVVKADSGTPYFGENCILSSQMEAPSGASVTTREPASLLVIGREAAADFLAELPEFGHILLERKAMLRRTNQRMVESQHIDHPGRQRKDGGATAQGHAAPS